MCIFSYRSKVVSFWSFKEKFFAGSPGLTICGCCITSPLNIPPHVHQISGFVLVFVVKRVMQVLTGLQRRELMPTYPKNTMNVAAPGGTPLGGSSLVFLKSMVQKNLSCPARSRCGCRATPSAVGHIRNDSYYQQYQEPFVWTSDTNVKMRGIPAA